MKISRKLLFYAGAAATAMVAAAPANAYWIQFYWGPPGPNTISGAEMYCDNGTLFASGGIITFAPAYIEYHTGEAPC